MTNWSGITRTWTWSAATVPASMPRPREGAPQAKQVADRFHLMQNFRETVERQLGGYEAPIRDSKISGGGNRALPALPARSDRRSDAVARTRLIRRDRQAVRQQIFNEIRAPL